MRLDHIREGGNEMSEREIFILDAQATLPDGTVQQLSSEEAQALMAGSGVKSLGEQGTMDVTISWIEGTPGQILDILCGFPLFEKAETK
jgi:hypothetical protein